MDFFDGEWGGRDDNSVDTGGGCSWVTVVLIGVAVLILILMNWLWDLLHRVI
ncbi:hypothetical protein ACIGW7_12560 [Streptomyces sp. NPDC053253]|uniref:hypothetical protein n=1 Tax=unclassified Streptomyces TaxID=2593676 RepID=UPI0037D16325